MKNKRAEATVKCLNITVLLCLFLISVSSFAYPLKIEKGYEKLNIGMSVEYYEDKAASLTLEDVIRLDNENKFISTTKVPLNFGYSSSTYWVSFSVYGQVHSDSGWVLDVPYAPLDFATLYIPQTDGRYIEKKGGDRITLDQKDLRYKNPAFFLGQYLIPYQQYYLKVSSQGSVNIPLYLRTAKDFGEHINFSQTGLGIYFGLMLTLILYNMYLFSSFKDRDFLLCSAVILSYLFVQSSYYGISSSLIWPNLIWWSNISLVIFAALIFLTTAVFAYSFLQLKVYSSLLSKIMKFNIYYYLVMLAASLVISYRIASIAIACMAIFLIVTVFISAMYVYSKGYKPARIFLLAWSFFLLGMSLLLLKLVGVLPPVFITEYSVHIGFSINCVLMSFALLDRINILRQEKDRAQQEALLLMKEAEEVKTRFLEDTEKLVIKRTQELETANKRLEEIAATDVLTGLKNRRLFNVVIEEEFKSAKKLSKELSLLLIGIDYFRNYNDYYGHQEGDACLVRLAKIISSCVGKEADAVYRFSGEEFAVIFPGKGIDDTMILADYIRQTISESNIEHKMSPLEHLTVSCGAATVIPMEKDDLEQFISSASRGLFKAKASGRNSVSDGSI